MSIVAAVAAAGVSGPRALAAQPPSDFVEPAAVVTGHPGVTYLDLVRQAVPDIAESRADKELQGHFKAQPRHLAGRAYEGDPPDPLVLGLVEEQRIVVGGRRRIVLLADFGPDPDRAQSTSLLLLYDDAASPRLLDAADVGVDRDTSFSEQARLKLGPGDDALVTYSEHSNTSETYATWLIVEARGDRLHLVDKVFAPSERRCGWLEQQTPTFATRPDPGHAYNRIDVVVTDIGKRQDEDCGDAKPPRPFSHVWRASYRWNAAAGRFEDRADVIKRLDKHNMDLVNSDH